MPKVACDEYVLGLMDVVSSQAVCVSQKHFDVTCIDDLGDIPARFTFPLPNPSLTPIPFPHSSPQPPSPPSSLAPSPVRSFYPIRSPSLSSLPSPPLCFPIALTPLPSSWPLPLSVSPSPHPFGPHLPPYPSHPSYLLLPITSLPSSSPHWQKTCCSCQLWLCSTAIRIHISSQHCKPGAPMGLKAQTPLLTYTRGVTPCAVPLLPKTKASSHRTG